MSAMGTRQHPQQGPLLSGSGVAVGERAAGRRDPPPVCFGRAGADQHAPPA
ncbi:MAG: hypothetical protein VKK97_11380 [Synechococcaceae cyanobacterium]|nr:hypothetical protein [Synechococcaceae cyanobacterium]